MPLALSIDTISILKTWIDTAYTLHGNITSHKGGITMMGKGALYAKSSKQKLNTKSSTEAKRVGATNFVTTNLWTVHFIDIQGYIIKENNFAHNNKSAMSVE